MSTESIVVEKARAKVEQISKSGIPDAENFFNELEAQYAAFIPSVVDQADSTGKSNLAMRTLADFMVEKMLGNDLGTIAKMKEKFVLAATAVQQVMSEADIRPVTLFTNAIANKRYLGDTRLHTEEGKVVFETVRMCAHIIDLLNQPTLLDRDAPKGDFTIMS